jgi:hypothetical protein
MRCLFSRHNSGSGRGVGPRGIKPPPGRPTTLGEVFLGIHSFQPVLGIRIRMLLGLPAPDPVVSGTYLLGLLSG